MLVYSHLMTILEEIIRIAFNQLNFCKDKPKPLNVRTVCGVKILTIFERAIR